jgi:hypothetical protein
MDDVAFVAGEAQTSLLLVGFCESITNDMHIGFEYFDRRFYFS